MTGAVAPLAFGCIVVALVAAFPFVVSKLTKVLLRCFFRS